MKPRNILYVTVDGVLQPLPYSQVCRVLFGLARQGFRYELLSMERAKDLANTQRVEQLRAELAAHGVSWTYVRYDEGGTAKSAGRNLLALGQNLRRLVKSANIGLIHARGYHAASVALAQRRFGGVPYLFDARGRWIDERLVAGRWFRRPSVERVARGVERRLYGGAVAIVVLTQLQADDVHAGAFGPDPGVPVRVITTCADFQSFSLEARHEPARRATLPPELSQRLEGKLVLAFVGSTNASYRYEESFALATRILARRRDAHLLILTPQLREFEGLARDAALAEDRVTIHSANHRDMPSFLTRIDWAIQLLNSGVAKRGSMPTKLAEFFAAGVRPVHFGCNDEVDGWVERAGSGYVLKTLDDAALDAAADFVATAPRDEALLAAARDRAAPHFDLAHGLGRYEQLLASLGFAPSLGRDHRPT